MERYKKPQINQIKLDSKQAILQVCFIGGVYFAGGICMQGIGPTGGFMSCGVDVKGQSTTTRVALQVNGTDAIPS